PLSCTSHLGESGSVGRDKDCVIRCIAPPALPFAAETMTSTLRLRLKAALAGRDRTLHVAWQNDVEETLDLMPILLGSRQYVRLRANEHLFRSVRVGSGGGFVEW